MFIDEYINYHILSRTTDFDLTSKQRVYEKILKHLQL